MYNAIIKPDKKEAPPIVQKTKKKSKKRRWLLRISLLVLLLAGGFHYMVMTKVSNVLNVKVKFSEELKNMGENLAIESKAASLPPEDEANFAPVASPSPFKEIYPFDDDAKSWATYANEYSACGLLLSDVNGDEKLDAYFLNPGDNWVRATDENGVLMDKPRLQHNALFINMGNDEEGNPIFKKIDDIARLNDTYVKEELLIENYIYPRTDVDESRERVGRCSKTAISVDLNSDGLQDLIVGNGVDGMIWSDPKSQRVMSQFVRPVGRQANHVKTPMRGLGLGFLKDYVAEDNMHDRRETARGEEFQGANSVFLNTGDKDGDGLPEWKDITAESGLGGKRNTTSILAADFDLDGDLDIFEGNVMDMDYWPGGAQSVAGAANQLYINQLVETGELTFIEKSAEMNVDGLYDEGNPMPPYYRIKKKPFLPLEYSVAFLEFEPYNPGWLVLNGQEIEHGQISWSTVVQDANHDGYPDIWVANDLGWLRLYLNDQGKGFTQPEKYVRHDKSASWMSFAPGDFNGDLKEDLFAGNVGGASMNTAMSVPDPRMLFYKPGMVASTMAQQYFSDRHRTMHAIVDGNDYQREFQPKVKHSEIIPPDAAIPNNVRPIVPGGRLVPYDINGLDPYEFTWGSTVIDVQNDGMKDIYWIGCLYGAGGGIFPITGTGPGRLLVNATKKGSSDLSFVDQTAEYNVLNILELNYDRLEAEGYIYRKAPTKNWGKRSMVYSYDTEVWGLHGPGIMQKVSNRSMIQLSEEGRAVVAADINNDGFQDIVLRNIGGYDSRKSSAVNLKSKINGKVQVVPTHDANFPTPTNFEPGDSRVFINTHTGGNFLKVNLFDNTPNSFNKNAIGAKVIINGEHLIINRIGSGGFVSNYCGPLHFGLGEESAVKIEIQWPDKAQTKEVFELENLANGTVTIEKNKGVVNWKAKQL